MHLTAVREGKYFSPLNGNLEAARHAYMQLFSITAFLALGLASSFATAAPPTRSRPSSLADMVQIPGGTFKMGAVSDRPDEAPVHTVTVSTFSICKHEVTVAEFTHFVKA